jgi:hypothetical protein
MNLRAILTAGALAAVSMACGSGEQGPSPVASPTAPGPVLATPSAPLSTIENRNWGWLAPDPGNPRYLRTGGDSGQPFAMASYGTMIGCGFSPDQVRRLKERGATYAVLWYQWSGCTREAANWFRQPWTGPWRLACDPRDPAQRAQCPDHPLWDLSQFDEDYWRTLDAMLAAAEDDRDGTNRKLVVRVHLFARQEFNIGREDNPFRGVNNVNGVRSYEVGSDARDPDLRYFAKAPLECEISCGEPIRSLFAYQKAYVQKLLDVTHGHENVVYEMMNEPPVAANDPTGGSFAYFAMYWSWFVKDYLASHYGVARLVSQDERNAAFQIPNIDVADARWPVDDINTAESVFLASLNDLASALRTSYHENAKMTTLDEFANAVEDPDRLRREAWTVVTSGGNFHFEDPCDPQARACDGADSKPWLPVQSIQAFKTASGWRFDRAQPVYRDTPGERWFYWMVQKGPPYDTVGFPAAGAQDHVGYLAHHTNRACRGEELASELPAVPPGASEYVARLWDPAGTDYLKGDAGTPLEYRFRWGGGVLDWCETPLKARILGADDVVIHVHAGR